MRILHIDDDLEDLELVRLQLQKLSESLQINCVRSGSEALALLSDTPFDCIICDYRLRRTSGLELLRTLRKARNFTPFIILTGKGNEEVAAEAFRAGADDYFVKSGEVALCERLLRSINRIVGNDNHLPSRNEDEDAYRKAEKRLRTYIENNFDMVYFQGLARSPSLLGDAFSKITGRQTGESTPENQLAVESRLQGKPRRTAEIRVEHPEKAPLYEAEYRIRTTDGEKRTILSRKAGVRDSAGEQVDFETVESKQKKQEKKEVGREVVAAGKPRKSDVTDSILICLDRENTVTMINKKGCEILGCSEEQVVGKNWCDHFIPPRYIDEFQDFLSDPLEGKTFEGPVATGNGDEKITAWNGTFLRSDTGEVIAKIISGVDVSDGLEMEDALQALEKKYRNIFENANEGIAIIQDLKFQLFNPKALEITGYEADEITEKSIEDLLHPDDGEGFFDNYRMMLNGQVDRALFEFRIIDKHCYIKWLEVNAVRIGWEDEPAVLGFLTDVSGRKRAEAALRESERTNLAILNALPDLMFHINKEGLFIRYRAKHENGLALAPDQFIGKKITEVLPAEAADIGLRAVRMAIATGEMQIFEYRLAAEDTERFFEARVVKLREDEALAIVRDISKRKKAEHEMSLSQEKLKAQSRRLFNAKKELETFSYSVSHDLRAPLLSIDGFSQVLMRQYGDKLDKRGQDYLLRLKEATKHAIQLIEELLKLSRLTKAEIKREKINLSELALGIAEALKVEKPERQVEFVIADNVHAEGDGRLVRVLMENLLGNAWKFTSKRKRARIEFGIEERKGKTLFFVQDNGAGFDMTKADSLFLPFKRLHKESQFAGTGIGLATVRKIVERHGGQVWAEGEVDKGAVFYFTLS